MTKIVQTFNFFPNLAVFLRKLESSTALQKATVDPEMSKRSMVVFFCVLLFYFLNKILFCCNFCLCAQDLKLIFSRLHQKCWQNFGNPNLLQQVNANQATAQFIKPCYVFSKIRFESRETYQIRRRLLNPLHDAWGIHCDEKYGENFQIQNPFEKTLSRQNSYRQQKTCGLWEVLVEKWAEMNCHLEKTKRTRFWRLAPSSMLRKQTSLKSKFSQNFSRFLTGKLKCR